MVAVFADIQTLDFFLRADAYAENRFDQQPGEHRRHEDECADGDDADRLFAKQIKTAAEEKTIYGAYANPLLRKDADKQSAEYAVHQMDGQGANRIVELDTVKEHDGENDEDAGNCANDE